MIKLAESLKHWGDASFPAILKIEIMKIGVNHLPLQKAVSPGKFISEDAIDVMVLTVDDDKTTIKVNVGIMFSEVLWGYCCGEEEPMVNSAYCELSVLINKITADTIFEAVKKGQFEGVRLKLPQKTDIRGT